MSLTYLLLVISVASIAVIVLMGIEIINLQEQLSQCNQSAEMCVEIFNEVKP
jgi:hypothetical protein